MRYMLLLNLEEQSGTPDPAAARAMSEPYVAYTEWLIGEGIYRGGDRLAGSQTATTVRVRDGRRLVTDGPFVETKEVLGGYYLLECDDLDKALEAAARCPAAANGTIEVRPIVDMATPARASA